MKRSLFICFFRYYLIPVTFYLLITAWLDAEIRFTGGNPEEDEKFFRRVMRIIESVDPDNSVLFIEDMEEIVYFLVAPDDDNFGTYTHFSDGRNSVISLIPPEEYHSIKDVAVIMAHEGKHFLNHSAFPFCPVEDMFPPSYGLIFQAINEGSAFYNSIKTAELVERNKLLITPKYKPSFRYYSIEYVEEHIGGDYITNIGVDLKKWMRMEDKYGELSEVDFEKEFKREFFKLYLECTLYPMMVIDTYWYNEDTVVWFDDFDSYILGLPSWANPEFAYLWETDIRNFLINTALKACFGDIGLNPEELDEILNETLAIIDVYRESVNLPTIAQVENSFHEHARNINNNEWIRERGAEQMIIMPTYFKDARERVEAIINSNGGFL